MLKFRVVHENQIEHKRYFHAGLKRPFLKPTAPRVPKPQLGRNDSLQPPTLTRGAASQIVRANQVDDPMTAGLGKQDKPHDLGRNRGRRK